MSYQVLARKWRPQQFNDMIGQEHVLKALNNALATNRLHHAYLFTGMRGVGKTTIARIFAKCLNCERAEHATAEPCGECSTCKDIEAGRFFDLIEVDAASRTKVEETRELLENVPYAPTSGRFKVYLIDEVHMFSNHSFNALLKTLEEPPSHVKFLLATTDPQKVPVTVLSRCLQFNLKRMVPSSLADYLETILNEESISHERGALDLIARAADGSVRDALSLVEQSAAYGNGAVRVGEVESMLGRVSVARLLDLLEALATNDVNLLFERINALAKYAPDFHQLLGELLSITHKIALLQTVPGSVEPEATELDQLKTLADNVSVEDIQLWYQIGMHARRDMPFAPDPREAFDMAMLRMLAFAPQADSASPITNSKREIDSRRELKTIPKQAKSQLAPASVTTALPTPAVEPVAPAALVTPSPSITPSPSASASRSPVESVATAAATPAVEAVPTVMSSVDRKAQLDAALGLNTKKKLDPVESPAKADPEPAGKPTAEAPIKTTQAALPLTNEHWPIILRCSDLSGLPLQLAMNCAVDSYQNGLLALRLAKPAQHLAKAATKESLAKAIGVYCDEPVKVTFESTNDALVTPSVLLQRAAREAQENAELSIQNDPLLAELLSRVDGEVTQDSVRPNSAPADDIATKGDHS